MDEEKIGERSEALRGGSAAEDARSIGGLDEWKAMEPPADFADRVMAARDAGAQKSPPTRRLRAAIGAGLLLATAAAWLFAVRGGDAIGQAAPLQRASLQLGRRGIAVAEAGARLDWQVRSGDARIRQSAGNVFYRVEKGGPFVVSTPAGDVTVQGTCFRVEVEPMLSKQQVIAAGVGAAIASTVLVSVYEGRVLLANEHGKTVLSAGEQGSARSGRAPDALAQNNDAVASKNGAIAQNSTPPPEGITREQLLLRDQQQRAELDKLRARVQQLEVADKNGDGKKKDERPFFDPSKDELQQMAKDCKLKWDHPPIVSNIDGMGFKNTPELGITDQERAEIIRVRGELNARVLKDLRGLYVEVTGDKTGADSLAPQALENEIMSKSPEEILQQVFYKLSHERAGMAAAPTSTAGEPAAERLMRMMTNLGDDYEQKLGAAIGPDRAHQLRAEQNGWGSRSQASVGCPGE
jgi:hypothetical protein